MSNTGPTTKSPVSWAEQGKARLTVIVFVVTHLVGIGVVKGLGNSDFLLLTPLQLLTSFSLLIWNHEEKNAGLWLYLALAFLTGYFVEVAGVATGVIFGSYSYGEVLGPKLLDTPLLIGINWAMLVYAANITAKWLLPSGFPMAGLTLIGGAIPVALDWFLEPVAIEYGMWSWEGGVPPLQNYIGWLVVSLLLSYLCQRLACGRHNSVAPWLISAQFVFFMALQA